MGYKEKDVIKTSLYGRVSQLLESFEWSDCSFIVGGKQFPAHRLLLAISSPVFKAMLYGPLSNDKEVVISDINPDIFQLLINYVYTDKVEIYSIDYAFELLYAAKKYMLEDLVEKCIDFIETNMSVDSVISILNYSEYMQETRLSSLALQMVCEHPNYVLKDSLDKISIASMKKILKTDNINITELELIKTVFHWSQIQCKDEEIREFLELNDLFILLRFSCLSSEELKGILSLDSNLLSPEHLKSLHSQKELKADKVSNESKNALSSVMTVPSARGSVKVRSFLCHRSSLRSAAPLIIDSSNNSIKVRTRASKTVFINSVRVPSRMSPVVTFHNDGANVYSEQFSVIFEQESDNTVIKSINFMNTVEHDAYIIIQLSEPCILKQDEWYKIVFTWPENQFYTYKYILGQRNNEVQGKVNFIFEDLKTNGSFLESFKYS